MQTHGGKRMMSWKTKMLRRCTAVLLLAAVITASVFALSVSAQLFGDIDGDGKITYDDAQLVFDYVAGCGKLSISQLASSDMNRDGSVTIADAAMLFHYVSKTIASLPFDEDQLSHIVILSAPSKTQYYSGDSYDYTGLSVGAVYGEDKVIAVSDFSVSVLGAHAPGVKIVTVSYKGKQAAFTFNVFARSVTGISIFSLPSKTTYSVGESFQPAGLNVRVIYDNGSQSSVSGYAIDGFESDTAGSKKITVFYNGYSASFDVTVIVGKGYVSAGGSALNVRSSPSLDGTVLGTFSDGTALEVISLDGEWAHVRGTSSAGKTLEGYCSAEYISFS